MPEVMTPAAPVQSAPATPAAPVAPAAPATSGGFFDHMAIASPEAKPSTAEIKTDSGKTAEIAKPAETSKIYAGRFKSPEELEIGYRESSSEGLRLYQENRLANQQVQELKSKLAEMEESAKLGSVLPAFRELTPEQESKLWESDPKKAAEYVADKKFHERDTAAAKEKMKADRESAGRRKAETEQFILNRGKELSSNPEKYPHFEELTPEMDAIARKLGPDVQGKPWAVDTLYLATLGRMYLQTLRAGKTATAGSRESAKIGAESVATASASAGASPTEIPGKVDPNSDKSVMDRIIKAGNQTLFKV